MWKLRIYRGKKYTDSKVYETAEQARIDADKRKTGQIVLCKGLKWRDGTTTWMHEEVLKGNVTTIEKERDDWGIHDERIIGETLEGIYGKGFKRCDRYVVVIDENGMSVHRLEYPVDFIDETASGFVKRTEYKINKYFLRIVKNEMMSYTFEDFFDRVSMTDEEEKFLRAQYGEAEITTKPVDWDMWHRYEAQCGGDDYYG